ncbi:MAG: family 16 glycoside hydrolase [Bacteroidota bacterium]|nr:family 16 glycoside hydrolase [Bacteroidota bacterium]
MKINFLIALLTIILNIFSNAQNLNSNQKWIPIFNGKNLKGWDIKITGSDLNVNYKNTFVIENGILKANYNEYKTFNSEYGHLYYQTPYSHYRLRVEYRFTGNQTPGGESWNVRNSGVMIHSQSAKSVGKDQSFPISLEVQFLGGLGKGERPTANLCTPGTTVEYQGKTILDHIINSKSKTYHGDVWVTVDVVVLGDSVIHHIIGNDTVLTYYKPKIGGGFVNPDYDFEKAKVANAELWKMKDNTPLKSGFIALQAESHPIEFRKVELLPLKASIDTTINNSVVSVFKTSSLLPNTIADLSKKLNKRLIIFLDSCTIKKINDKGNSETKNIKPGDHLWIESNQIARFQNLSQDYISFYEVEFKKWEKLNKSFVFPPKDPVTIDPKHYKTTFENELVRVVYASFEPKAVIPMHEHKNDRVIIFLTEHPLKLTIPSGESFNINESAGSVYFGGEAVHAEDNLSDQYVNTIFIDLKK